MGADDEIDLGQVRLAAEWINLTEALRAGRQPPNPVFWETLVAGTLAASRTLPPGQTISRARLMPPERELDADPLRPPEMGPPPPEKALAFRLNPSGVPRFYGALDRDTAIAELRPWRRARITTGQFLTTAELHVADLTSQSNSANTDVGPIHWLSFMLGRPVHRDDSESYVASQRLAETCRESGLDGMLYDSALRPGGVNVVLFSDTGIACATTELYEVTSLQYTSVRMAP